MTAQGGAGNPAFRQAFHVRPPLQLRGLQAAVTVFSDEEHD
jgi:hypothetical protein